MPAIVLPVAVGATGGGADVGAAVAWLPLLAERSVPGTELVVPAVLHAANIAINTVLANNVVTLFMFLPKIL